MDVKARKIGPAGFADRKPWTHILETARERDPEAFALADGVEACDADEKEARSTMRAMGWSDERIEQTITSATPDEPLLLPWPEDFDPGPGELVRQEFDPPLPASQRRISGAA